MRAGRTVPERILGSVHVEGKKSWLHRAVTGSVPGSDLAWQNSLRVRYGCACGVKHTRGWPEQTTGCQRALSSQASCVHVPYRARHTYTLMSGELSRETCSFSAPTAVMHCCTEHPLAKLVRLFALGLAGPNRSRVPTARLSRSMIGCMLQFQRSFNIFASEICRGNWEGGPAGCAIFMAM